MRSPLRIFSPLPAPDRFHFEFGIHLHAHFSFFPPRPVPIDINLLREEKGGNPEIVRESQRRRHASVELVDEVIELDRQWRACTISLLCFSLFLYVSLVFFVLFYFSHSESPLSLMDSLCLSVSVSQTALCHVRLSLIHTSKF